MPLRFGPTRVVLLGHPDDIERVLVTDSCHFVKSPGYRLMRHLLGDGLLTSEGGLWRRHRRPVQPAFHGSRIAAYGQVMADCATRRIACPVLVLWGRRGRLEARSAVLAIWREWADGVRGRALDRGHSLAEEAPEASWEARRAFVAGEGRGGLATVIGGAGRRGGGR
ncbi:MAG TPA: cytochrome P450, partial [Thermodesulfobacteriota bacterium]|nr:cytochrome P450 [Thermodesulfobacteriota bacterium]